MIQEIFCKLYGMTKTHVVTNHSPDKTLLPYITYIMKATTQAPPYTDGAWWKCETAVTATNKAILIVDKMTMKISCSRVNM